MSTLTLEQVAQRTGQSVDSLREQQRKVKALRDKRPITQENAPAPTKKAYTYSPTGGPLGLQKQMQDMDL
jgi:hypothetical protein